MKRFSFAALVAALAFAGCGASQPRVHAAAAPCPANLSQLGCNTPRTAALSPTVSAPTGLEFPDVSVWQGAVNWPAVAAWQRSHGWHPTAIFKLGEYTLDGQAVRNAGQTAALGFWRAGYWFVRATGVQHEASLIVWAAKRFRLTVIVLDAEVPEARGYTAALTRVLKAAGITVVEYTSPGSNPDSSNPGDDVWAAAFGPAHAPCVWTCSVGQFDRQSIIAWQFTDGRWGPVVDVPGIGRDDVNVDYGITRLPLKPAPAPAKKWASAEVQLRALTGATTVRIVKGHWTIGNGWRVRPLPLNAPPLGH